jgi:hypothetical protein
MEQAYILSSLSGTLYIGFTSDLDQWQRTTLRDPQEKSIESLKTIKRIRTASQGRSSVGVLRLGRSPSLRMTDLVSFALSQDEKSFLKFNRARAHEPLNVLLECQDVSLLMR